MPATPEAVSFRAETGRARMRVAARLRRDEFR